MLPSANEVLLTDGWDFDELLAAAAAEITVCDDDGVMVGVSDLLLVERAGSGSQIVNQ